LDTTKKRAPLCKDFNGKIAIITGASRGMERGIALYCAKKEMNIVLANILGLNSSQTPRLMYKHKDIRDFFNKYGFSIEEAVRVL